MGQKVNPIGLRLGINRTWDSRWFANTGEYGKLLHEDLKIRKYLEKELKQAAISKIVIERPHKKCRVTIHSARPGLIIGKKGADIEKLRRKLTEMTAETHLNIVGAQAQIDATLVAQSIAQQLERRVAFRRASAPQSAIARRRGHPHQLPARRRRDRAHGMVPQAAFRHTLRADRLARPKRRPPCICGVRCGCSRADPSTTRWLRTQGRRRRPCTPAAPSRKT